MRYRRQMTPISRGRPNALSCPVPLTARTRDPPNRANHIARQSGGLDRQNGANPAFTDRGEQLLEPRSYDAAAGSTEIIINNLHVAPAEPPRPLNQTVLASPALGIVRDLIGCRLPYIDDGAPSKMISRDLRHDRPPAGAMPLPAPRPRRLLPPEGLRAVPVPSRAEAPAIRSAAVV